VLGAWPDLDTVSAVAAVQFALQTVAEAAAPESAPIVRRIGIVGELSDAIITLSVARGRSRRRGVMCSVRG
jgi:hypothetical protein